MSKNQTDKLQAIEPASWITLRWTRGTRYFRVHLEQDLWSDWLLTQVNVRIGTRLGRASRSIAFY